MNEVRHIKTAQTVDAIIDVPTSKSIMNRALIVAALVDGVTKIINPSPADDCKLMAEGLRKFGITIEEYTDYLLVHGCGGKLTAPKSDIYVGNAGTTMRFLAGLASVANGATRLVGSERMNKRPLNELLAALDQMGVKYESDGGYPPLIIHGGNLRGGDITINGTRSSQFISSLLLVAPFTDSDVNLMIADKLISKPYIDLTLEVMNKFGVEVKQSENIYKVTHGCRYKAIEFTIEGDASSASYFFAAAAVTGGKVLVRNLSLLSKQGDIKFLDILQQMGCAVTTDVDDVCVRGGQLSSISIDMNEIPDMVPTLAVIALFAEGKTCIRNVKHLRYKESDRLSAITTELRKLGAEVTELEDGLEIEPGNLKGSNVETYEDHRLAMSFAIAGLRIPDVSIINPNCVVKSFPGFWNEWNKIEGE
jgi:3-phosphoshikimate 1-carboxyvinyltransferase